MVDNIKATEAGFKKQINSLTGPGSDAQALEMAKGFKAQLDPSQKDSASIFQNLNKTIAGSQRRMGEEEEANKKVTKNSASFDAMA